MSCDLLPHSGILLDAQSLCGVVHLSHPSCHQLLEVVHWSGTDLHPGEDPALQVGQTGTLWENLYPGGNIAAFKG